VAGKFHALKTNEYRYVKEYSDQAKLTGGTRMRTPPKAPSVDSNVITAYNVDDVDLIRGAGVSITEALRDPGESNMLSRFMGRKAVRVKRAFINPGPTSGETYPGDGHSPGPIAITYEAIPAGGIGRIVVSGPAYAYLYIVDYPVAVAYPTRVSTRKGLLDAGPGGQPGCEVLAAPAAIGASWALVNVGSFTSPYATVYRCQLKGQGEENDEPLVTGDATAQIYKLVPYNGVAINYDPTATVTATNFLALEGVRDDAAVIRYSAHDQRWDLMEVTC
jgi:hypothetical protein